MKYLIVFLAFSSFAHAKTCNVKEAVMREAADAVDAYNVEAGEDDALNDAYLSPPELVKGPKAYKTYSVPLNYNDICYGDVTVKINPKTCEIAGKSEINEGICTDD